MSLRSKPLEITFVAASTCSCCSGLSAQVGFALVSASNLGAVETYIQNQAIHHKKITFEQEFVALLEKHGIDFDPKYVFG